MIDNFRKQIASLAKDYLENRISYEDFIKAVPEDITGDEDIDDLIDLIEHEPTKKGFWGISERSYSEYKKKIWQLIDKLSK